MTLPKVKVCSYSYLKKRGIGMKGIISEWIFLYKTCDGNRHYLLKIIDKFEPLIKKYANKFPRCDCEDVCQEMAIAVIEAVNKIKKYDNEAQCVKYISMALKMKFVELYRKKKRIEEYQIEVIPLSDEKHCESDNPYEEIELLTDLNKLKRTKNRLQSQIASYILAEGLTDAEIGEKLNISRQYVNRCKKEIFAELKEYHKS